ncbi:putative 2-dehydropantoate 2-reductase [Pseudomonas sp. LS44]|uniref:putative 2-dehydropantoate 2-reductase n=1 Tax=Pseudomonas sp. LS44 TaxID=1357074 RepID=UPI00215B5247|nr:putative 2-dehydropantoate 2-reductase [Pseudomonas sp. LS44]UVE19289.1 putative 2-dehydropantoate 2-reductase [Pseudomonas sp. LS44]
MSNANTRIGIIGAGAIGGFYGVMLARAGFDVHFLYRSEFAAVQEHGLTLKSKRLGDYSPSSLQAYGAAADMPPCDWLLVAAKTTANLALAPSIAKVAAPGAKVVLLQNGLAVEDELRPLLPESLHLLGGLCLVSTHRRGPGMIEHYGGGRVNLGYHSGPAKGTAAQQIVEEGAGLFVAAGLEAESMDDLAQARWQKLLFNIPLNGLSVLLNSGSRALMTKPETRALVRELMDEVVAGAAACGHPVPAGSVEMAWASTDVQTDYQPSMFLDFAAQRPLEIGAIYAAPLAAVAKVGFAMPKIEMLYQSLCFLDERNRP